MSRPWQHSGTLVGAYQAEEVHALAVAGAWRKVQHVLAPLASQGLLQRLAATNRDRGLRGLWTPAVARHLHGRRQVRALETQRCAPCVDPRLLQPGCRHKRSGVVWSQSGVGAASQPKFCTCTAAGGSAARLVSYSGMCSSRVTTGQLLCDAVLHSQPLPEDFRTALGGSWLSAHAGASVDPSKR